MENRYIHNLSSFSESELRRVRISHAAVIGCGGLGGYVINALARFGVGELTLIDGDAFSETNLNRQLFAAERTLGKNKAKIAAQVVIDVNSQIKVRAFEEMLTAQNAESLLIGADIAIDCLDNIASRRLLGRTCERLGIPIVHSAISGLSGQVSCIFPGDKVYDALYPEQTDIVNAVGSPVFAPQLVASIQSCEVVRILAGREPQLRNSVLYVDLERYSFELVRLS